MKRILFVNATIGIGGTVKSLVELLNAFPVDRYEVHAAFLNIKGAFLSQLPKEVITHEIPRHDNRLYFKDSIRHFRCLESLRFLLLCVYSKIVKDCCPLVKYKYRKDSLFLDGAVFDLAVVYQGLSEECSYYVSEKVNADVKCAWVHEDVNYYPKTRYNVLVRFSSDYRKIFLPTERAREHFNIRYPQMAHLTDSFANVIPAEQIVRLAERGDSYHDGYNGIRLLTVGRMAPQKNQLMAIRVLKLLKDKSFDVKWYLVGVGGEYMHKCELLASRLGVEDSVVFLGAQTNPYAYMRDCDIYVQPSVHESFCITLGEALCFGNPIVCTDFCGVEQMKGRSNVYIVETSIEGIADGIIKALNAEKVSVNVISTRSDLPKLLSLMEI